MEQARVEVFPIFGDLAEKYWPSLRFWIHRARARAPGDPELSDEDLLTRRQMNRMQLWPVISLDSGELLGVFATEILENEHGKCLNYRYVISRVGHLHTWIRAALKQSIKWAKQNDCKYATGGGRRGWGRLLRGFGFEDDPYLYLDLDAFVLAESEVSDGRR